MFKKLFYRIKAFLIALFTPSLEKVIAKTVSTLETITANYDAALLAEADLRFESYNRQFEVGEQERAVRELSDSRARVMRAQRINAAQTVERLNDIV